MVMRPRNPRVCPLQAEEESEREIQSKPNACGPGPDGADVGLSLEEGMEASSPGESVSLLPPSRSQTLGVWLVPPTPLRASPSRHPLVQS